MSQINFTKTLSAGVGAYNRTVGQWWVDQTRNKAHAAAYKNIASHVVRCAKKNSGLIIDYGCGTGRIMKRLVDALPGWTFLGIDGSQVMLRDAEAWARAKRKKHSVGIEFRCATLPDFSTPAVKADIIVFTFPNMLSPASGRCPFQRLFQEDRDLAWLLARKQEKGKKATELFEQLFMSRVVSRNLRLLLRKGGLCVRVDYCQGDRHELGRFDQLSTLFEEGSLSTKQAHLRPHKFFKLLTSQYYESAVIRDVHAQTKDQDFLEGGYLISLLQAM